MSQQSETPPKIIRCAIYIRVSTDEQVKDDSHSLRIQEEAGMEDIRNNLADGWIFVKTFADTGYTGLTWDRPGLNEIISAARSREIDMVLFYKRDRFFRSADLAAQAEGILESCNVGLFSHLEGLYR